MRISNPLVVAALAALLGLCACDPGGTVSEPLSPTPFVATTAAAPAGLVVAPGFADERGGGIFVGSDGGVIRLRLDQSEASIESHPANKTAPGKALSVWPLGPFAGLVSCDNGLYLASSGWLIDPGWDDTLDPKGLIATALADDGATWVAHQSGLFRVEGGMLSELKTSDGAAITGITALAVSPAPDLSPGVWFAQGKKLSYAAQHSKTDFSVGDSDLPASALEHDVVALAGIGAVGTSEGELWVITDRLLWKRNSHGWLSYDLTLKPEQIQAAGRMLWLKASGRLFLYDANAASWSEATGLDPNPTLLAADASGVVWLGTANGALIQVSKGLPIRIWGLFETQRIYVNEVQLEASLLTSAMPQSVDFTFDALAPVHVTPDQALPGNGLSMGGLQFNPAGFDDQNADRPYSLSALMDGSHTLTVTAAFPDAGSSTRILHFDLQAGGSATPTYANDIAPINASRCSKCHTPAGPGHDLVTYDLWKADAVNISLAVTEKRMPADGPLDPDQIQKIQRWVNAGAPP